MADVRARVEPRRGLRSLSARDLTLLWAVLAVALLVRTFAIDWGLPPSTPEMAASGIRSSYAFDESTVLQSLTRTNPARLDLDPHLYHWGTLHLELVLFALEAAQASDVFQQPWRVAFGEMAPGDFEKIYIVGRMVSVAIDVLTVFLTFVLGLEAFGKQAGFWAAALVAVAPGHVLQASQIRVDVTATALTVLAAILAVRSLSAPRRGRWFLLGVTAGLAVAAKYSSLLIVAAICAAAVWQTRLSSRSVRWVGLGAGVGFICGEPFILTNTGEVLKQVGGLVWRSLQIPEAFSISKPMLLVEHLQALARFSLGVPAALLAVLGGWRLLRRPSPAATVLLAAMTAGVASLLPQNFPLLRYQLPLLPFCAVFAGFALDKMTPTWRWVSGLMAVATAMSASLAQVRFMSAPHPINLALAVVHQAVPQGEPVARIMPQVPPLDEKFYPMGPNPYMDDLTGSPPAWVVTADLPITEYPFKNQNLLDTRYERVAVFRSPRILGWATLGEWRAPHDWKYTHPTLILYRRR